MRTLNRSLLSDRRIEVDFTRACQGEPIRVLQVGEGNFLRAFAGWMIDVANGAGALNARISVVQPLPRGTIDTLNQQQGLYTVLLRGAMAGRAVHSRRLITCVDQALNPYADWQAMLALAADPSLCVVISNTTELGIAYGSEALSPHICPQGFPAKMAALLYERYRRLGGSPESGLVFLPCELIEANGVNLRRVVLAHAEDWALPADFIHWVKTHNYFCNTLVDRIVPGFPAAEAEALFLDQGYADPLLVATEPFHCWAIEGSAALAERLPLHKAGLNVIWTDDLQPYRSRKLRMLNAAHVMGALIGFCVGADTVKALAEDLDVAGFLRNTLVEEIAPGIALPQAACEAYADAVLERMRNPHIRHDVLTLTPNAVSKWQLRVLPSVRDYAAAQGNAPQGLAFSLAALLYFYRGSYEGDGEYRGRRGDAAYPIRDNPEVQARLSEVWRSLASNPDALVGTVQSVLGDPRLWGEDLNAIPALAEHVTLALARILHLGMKAALAEWLGAHVPPQRP